MNPFILACGCGGSAYNEINERQGGHTNRKGSVMRNVEYDALMSKLESLLLDTKEAAIAARRESEPMSHDRRLLMWVTSELNNMIDAVVDRDGID